MADNSATTSSAADAAASAMVSLGPYGSTGNHPGPQSNQHGLAGQNPSNDSDPGPTTSNGGAHDLTEAEESIRAWHVATSQPTLNPDGDLVYVTDPDAKVMISMSVEYASTHPSDIYRLYYGRPAFSDEPLRVE